MLRKSVFIAGQEYNLNSPHEEGFYFETAAVLKKFQL
jgi:hypothetical protein